MDELASPSSNTNTNNNTSTGVFIHDLSVRFNEQVIPLEALDPTEVLAEAKLQLVGSVSGTIKSGVQVCYEQTYRPFSSFKTISDKDYLNLGKFRFELKLRSGINNFVLKLLSDNGEILDKKEFSLCYKGSFREWNETIFIAFFLAILIRGLVVQAFWIPTGSMEPTLLGEEKIPETNKVVRSGDRILVNRFAYTFDFSLDGRLPFGSNARYWLKLPERGDIVVFKFPDKDPNAAPKDYIKRVIGLPGDEVKVVDGITYVNNIPLVEPYIKEKPVLDHPTEVVKQGYLFVMGDNRNNSYDSRFWGQMPLTNLKGQAIFSYLPLNRLGPIKSYTHENLIPGKISKSSN